MLAGILLVISSCNNIIGSGRIVSEKRTVGPFTGISASQAISVEVSIGAEPAVTVEADDNLIKYVSTSVSGGVLRIRMEDNTSFSNSHIRVYVTATELDKLTASTSADINVKDPIRSEGKLVFKASSSATIDASVEAPAVEAEANTSADIKLQGKTRDYKAEVSTSAEIKSAELMSENTDVTATTSGSARVHASITLKAKASTSGDIEYRGGASVEKNISSSGSVEKVN